MRKKLLIVSLIVNFVFFATAIFFVVKRWLFQYRIEHPTVINSYRNNWEYAEQVNLQTAYQRQVKIVMLGDSRLYKIHWDELLNRGDIANRGIGLDDTEGYLHRLQYVFNGHPAICFIEGGVNDIQRHIPEDSTLSNLKRLVDTFRSAHITPVLHTVLPVTKKFLNAGRVNQKVQSLNIRIRQLAADEGVDCIDLCPLLAPQQYLSAGNAQADGIHLTAKCYLVWKDAIEKLLREKSI